MAAILKRDPNPDSPYRTVRIASQAYAIGDILDWDRVADAVDVVPSTASSTTTSIAGVAMEAKASTDTSMLICLFRPLQEWVVDSTNNTASNHRYLRAIWGTGQKINNTGSDVTGNTGIFTQTGEVGAASAKQVIGQFNKVEGPT
jgi:hypothetical protein